MGEGVGLYDEAAPPPPPPPFFPLTTDHDALKYKPITPLVRSWSTLLLAPLASTMPLAPDKSSQKSLLRQGKASGSLLRPSTPSSVTTLPSRSQMISAGMPVTRNLRPSAPRAGELKGTAKRHACSPK